MYLIILPVLQSVAACFLITINVKVYKLSSPKAPQRSPPPPKLLQLKMKSAKLTKPPLQVLLSLRRQLEEMQQEHEQFRVQERERLRTKHERLLEKRMEEIHLAFSNAEVDQVKVLKLKLMREKKKRKKAEDVKKKVCKVKP